ncbi:pyridoxamine 5'-phosphate oxidase family protein [Blastococcus haudaquaticus]|uniref:Nitroimidazol reductase NimA, pyridoxamine 5'-phosphate oxidase superfamily n=1 Tax=Blastococcus haudaquaticus TaxID=1938745 RepID=A0A286H138_9ACTN|nr:pyridoxamine 5'-phosphate oxidase family protein [Blastococcus haudaquaticus]SOE01432.1 Nitroimidazol reductase NimA, pyridoxamine 5'-phosphate oxidase superfamily [Blastococcus haudaquaticus]
MTTAYPPSSRTTPSRTPDRVGYDRATVHAVLDEALVCHVGFVVDGRPVVLPQLHARVGEVLYLHGSTGARGMRAATGAGLDVCVTVTLLDGVVLARSQFNHSMNYRSVVAHGTATVVADATEKAQALDALVEAIAAGRVAGCRPPTRKEYAATTVLRLPLEEVSVKVRSGPPNDEDEDLGLPHWAGVLPLSTVAAAPVPSPDLEPGIAVPEHVRSWSRPVSG